MTNTHLGPSDYLRRLALRLPQSWHPTIRAIYQRGSIRSESLRSGRGVCRSQRVMFMAPEIADLDAYEFLAPGPDELQVDVVYNAVSVGTEVAQLLGTMPKGFPYWPGYSGAGIVSRVGDRISGIRIGDLVAGQFKHARRLVVKASKSFLLPPDIKLDEAAFMEIGIIVLQAIRKAEIRPGETTVVIGQGIIGQMANRLARAAGAGPIFAVASSARRQQLALADGGADRFWTLDAVEPDLADVVIEASGAPGAFQTALAVAKPQGRVVLLGSARNTDRNSAIGEYVQRKSLRVIGAHVSVMPGQDFSRGMWTYHHEGEVFADLLCSGKLLIQPIITHKCDAREVNHLYETLCQDTLPSVGVLLDWANVPPD